MSFAIGKSSLSELPVAAGPLHDPPTVLGTAPTGTVSSGGPSVPVTWTYDQPQGDPQEFYRIKVLKSAVVLYDTGWLAGPDVSANLDWDALELDGEDTFDVQVHVRGPASIGTGTLARREDSDENSFTLAFGAPALTVSAPTEGTIHTDPDSLTVTWSVSDGGHTQSAYRVQLRAVETNAILYTSGWVASAVTTHEVPYLFQDNTQIRVEVQTKNDQGMRSS